MADRHMSVWAAQEQQPDISELPVSFSIADCREGKGYGARTEITIDGDNVTFARALESGCSEIEAIVPLDTYLGVTMAVAVSRDETGAPERPAMMVMLEHEDPSLTLPVYVSWESDEVVDQWQSWARALDLPARVRGMDGTSHQPLGKVCGVDFSPSTKRGHAHRAGKIQHQRVEAARRASTGVVAGSSTVANREITARQ